MQAHNGSAAVGTRQQQQEEVAAASLSCGRIATEAHSHSTAASRTDEMVEPASFSQISFEEWHELQHVLASPDPDLNLPLVRAYMMMHCALPCNAPPNFTLDAANTCEQHFKRIEHVHPFGAPEVRIRRRKNGAAGQRHVSPRSGGNSP